jgi:acyl-coenzyme A thioesterase PaaI-like protein
MNFEPKFAGFAEKVERSFCGQSVMRFIGAELISVAPGEVDIRLPFRQELTQQDGFLHAGISTAIVDSACGYAALSLMPEDLQVLSGEYFVAEGRVLRAGQNLTVVRGDVFALDSGKRKQIVSMLGTMMSIKPS